MYLKYKCPYCNKESKVNYLDLIHHITNYCENCGNKISRINLTIQNPEMIIEAIK